ncbi:efflux RND transporter permease subunit [Denitromonas sp.]|uniref:efflux RND transporter permease subunit n=1 Tax=Denitromonas sp. TaxID=2734609 RepID=UPI002AFFFB21|nr:efflux RND transporter permease subunit [Denitromonas sp.]
MIGKIIQWSLANRLFVLAAGVLLMAWGGYQTMKMPVDVFPDLTAPQVVIVAEAHGMSPTEVESVVTFPIETAVNGSPGVRRVRSISSIGLSVVTVEFEWGTDILQARQIVAEKLQLARASLPPDLPPPQLAPAASVMGEIMFIALTSDRHAGAELKSTADWVLRRRILAVPGVAEVLTIGGDEKQYQVTLEPERLAAYGVTIKQVLDALRESNENAPAGFYQEGGQEYLIQGLGRIRDADDIGETVVTVKNGEPVLVRHLGKVGVGAGLKRGNGSHNGKPAVIFAIQKQPGANTLTLTQALDESFATMQASLPEGMKIETEVFRQSDFIERSIDNLIEALRDGAILVIAIVFVFLVSARATLITLVALPLSLVAAVLVMQALGATLNTMTLGGLAIALGALVDDAIIVVENIVRRLKEHARKKDGTVLSTMHVVYEATREIQGSIVFATLIIMLVFVPIFFLSGVEGRLLAPLGFAYVVALAASLLVAVTVTPVLSSLFLTKEAQDKEHPEPRWISALKGAYAASLRLVVKRWLAITLVSLAALAAALVAIGGAGRAFLPDFNEGSLTVNVTTLPGTTLDESDRLAQRVENILLAQPEVVSTARRTGRAPADPHAQEIYASEIETSLAMKDRSKEVLLAELRNEFGAIAGINVVVGQPISHRIDHMLSGTRANIAVKIFGPDLYELRRIGEAIKGQAETVPGAVDVALETQADIPFVLVKYRREAIARYGMSVRDVSEAIETAFAGLEVSRVLEGQAAFDLVVRFDPKSINSVDAIASTLITTASGARLPLSAVAEVRKDRGPNLVSRENVQRKIVVMANVAGRDLASVVEELRARVSQNVAFPTGYHVEYGGQFESAAEATRTLSILSVAVIAGIFLLLYLAFRSARDAVVVMLNLPLALIGGVVGMYLADGVLSVASLIGFITLFGIATRNGVMLIAHVRHLRETEDIVDPVELVVRGATERLVPILMTALATGLALVPLALAAGQPGSEIQAPMAMVILGGLASATVLNMVVVPALYLRFGSVGQSWQPHRPGALETA